MGGAVARNRARRRLRAAIEQLDVRLPAGAYLFGGDQGVLTMPFTELIAAVEGLVAELDEPG